MRCAISLLSTITLLFIAAYFSGKVSAGPKQPELNSSNRSVAEGGTIKGKVTYAGGVPAPQKIEITKDVQICGKKPHFKEDLIVSAEDKGLANVVVNVGGVKNGKSMDALGAEFQIDQNGCLFTPHIAVVPVGTTLKIKNSDGLLHNIHTHSEENAPFNKAQPRFLKTLKVSFDKPEIITVSCDVHSWMNGYIIVVEHPYYAVTDTNGNFELNDVPPGKYTLEYWHETLGKQRKEINVTAGGTVDSSFEYPKN